MILADKIIQLRKREGLSQEELAEKMNVSRQAVSKWESAQSLPDIDKILQLSRMFNVSTDYLLKDDIDDLEQPYKSSTIDTQAESVDENTTTQQKYMSYPLTNIVASSYWSLVTAIYLIWSFMSGDWDISWIVWPLSPLLYTPIVMLCKVIDRKMQK